MCSSSRRYQDILAPRKQECSNFMWASRQLNPQIAFKQDQKPSPQYHKDEVVKSPKIQELLITLSEKEGVAKEVLEAQVRSILDEIGYNKKLKVIRCLAIVLTKICKRICSGIYLNEDAVVQLKTQMGTCPVIFVPSHRSYADFILMSFVCFTEDVAIPAIAAGMDFHGMWGMGTMLRDTGAFFMRRSYNDDNLYWTTFKQYVYQLVTKGDLPLEFFIEGTRSRTNKSLMPKYGLILMILRAFFLSQVPDVLFVPINISYDRILEEKLFAFELLGIPKPKESTSGFFKSLSIVKEKFGSIYFDFAEPISAKKFFGPNLDRTLHNLQPIHMQEITDYEKKLIPSLAHEIVYKQQKHCVITTFNLLAIVLHNNLTSGRSLLSVDEIIDEILWLRTIIQSLGAYVFMEDPRKCVAEALEVHDNFVRVNEEGKVTLVWDEIVVGKVNVSKLKAHELSEKTITFSVPFILLQIYINPTLHYFVDVAILVMIVKQQKVSSQDELFGHYHFLRSLLSQEFITFNTREKMEFTSALEHALNLNLLRKNQEFYDLGENKHLEEVIYNCIDCFIFTYFVVCSVILELGRVIGEKTILAKVQEEVETKMNEGKGFIHPYSLSLDTITNCLNALAGQNVVTKSRKNGSITYEINNAKVLLIKNRLGEFVPPAQVLQEKFESVQLHLKNKL
ncbi:dihydroxyacetone phosphate acyltransferase [Tribolium madens]|uniref:dihydroxyacetone phosphate acyltransferase n=1 Tax=Tribolium madens TaxID=41895 RepID=UPI001CF748DF|nr:dihydroxyacetone phosphate acyltransferase [Tribolium madens]